ncbi:MAG: LptF/LptG family permease [Treponema sp.]|nr:LptF/LptG family permease [Treponema sp.]
MTLHELNKKIIFFLKKIGLWFAALPLVSHIIKAHNFIQVKVFKKGELKNHILIKYIFKDLFLYFLVSFLFFFMIFFVNQILLTVEDLLAKSAPFKDVMRIMFYSLPFIIAQSSPFATLVGFLMSLGGMMSNNEILIFRAAGFSFIRILLPTAILGLIISIASFFVNDYLLPLGQIKYGRLMREIMNSTPTIELESNSVKSLDSSNVVIGEVEGNSVSDLIIFDSNNEQDRLIFAGKSTLQGAKSEGVLMQFDMNDSTVLSISKNNRSKYDVMKSKNSILNIFDTTLLGNTSRSAREMTTYDLTKTIKKMKQDAQEDTSLKRRLNLWIMEYHKKFSLPFGSIFFAIFAFSIAFLFGKHNGQTIGLFLGLVVCVLYWAMQIMGQLFVQRVGLNAFWCIWIPNFVIGFFALLFLIILIKK